MSSTIFLRIMLNDIPSCKDFVNTFKERTPLIKGVALLGFNTPPLGRFLPGVRGICSPHTQGFQGETFDGAVQFIGLARKTKQFGKPIGPGAIPGFCSRPLPLAGLNVLSILLWKSCPGGAEQDPLSMIPSKNGAA
jgi:hypothetical protein